jgi:hypothetical protein
MSKFVKREGFDAKLKDFRDAVQVRQEDHYRANYTNLTPPTLVVKENARYVRLSWQGSGNESVFCFVEKTTGDIFKAAGWKAPAKHKRGSIYSDQKGMEAVMLNIVHIRYL